MHSVISQIGQAEYPKGETPQLVTTFINQFLKVRDDFPTDFHPLGWVYSTNKSWWGRMVGFVLAELGDLLKRWDYTIQLGPYSMASCKALTTFMTS